MIPVKFRALRSIHPLVACAALALLYLLCVSFLPANVLTLKQYGWDTSEYHVVYLMIVIPMVATWFAAFFGYYALHLYAVSIAKTKEGDSYRLLANGVGWLALSLPVPSITTLLLNSITSAHPDFLAASIILTNYITLLLPLIAFIKIGSAARQLTNNASVNISLAGARSIIFIFVILGVLFCYLVLRHFDMSMPSSNDNPYYMPVWIMLITIIVPYLYTWFVGLIAAYEFNVMASKVRGVLFSQPLRLFSFGLTMVIGSSIALQYIASASPRSGHLELNDRLLATYIFRLVAGLGFLLIAVGARKLKRIEEV